MSDKQHDEPAGEDTGSDIGRAADEDRERPDRDPGEAAPGEPREDAPAAVPEPEPEPEPAGPERPEPEPHEPEPLEPERPTPERPEPSEPGPLDPDLAEPSEHPEAAEPGAAEPGPDRDPDPEPLDRELGVRPGPSEPEVPDVDNDADDDTRPVPPGGTRRLWKVLRPRNRRAEYVTAALCVAFGFALAVQVAQSTGDQLASLRQDELVRLLDEVTQRGEQLDAEVANLTRVRDDLRSADGQDRAARELAEQRAEYEGILSGRLPAEGPGVVVEIQAGPGTVSAANMFNMLEELRNAGVEAQQVNDVRIVTSSHFEETVDERPRILLDGRLLEPPYTWVAIGDPETVDRALEIPGGALPTLRDAGASAEVTRRDHVVVDATRTPADPQHAEPSEE